MRHRKVSVTGGTRRCWGPGGTADAGQSASYQDNGIAHLIFLIDVAERVDRGGLAPRLG
jgi:hypothetical protein